MKLVQGIQGVAKNLVLVVAIATASTASEAPQFFIECYASGSAPGDSSKVYGYHLRARGFSEFAENGIDINLDEKRILLSVDTKQPGQEEASPLYTDLPVVQRNEQPCKDETCKKVDYEPKDFSGKLIVTYDKDRGGVSIQHAIAPDTVVESKGGCLFVLIPSAK